MFLAYPDSGQNHRREFGRWPPLLGHSRSLRVAPYLKSIEVDSSERKPCANLIVFAEREASSSRAEGVTGDNWNYSFGAIQLPRTSEQKVLGIVALLRKFFLDRPGEAA